MYCPRCALPNTDDARFCRGCGTDLGAVSAALTDSLVAQPPQRIIGWKVGDVQAGRGVPPIKPVKEASLDKAVRDLFVGLGFVFVSLCVLFYMPAGRLWWFWMLIPAFAEIGNGVAAWIRWRQSQQQLGPGQINFPISQPPFQAGFGRTQTAELEPHSGTRLGGVPSVTEETTRQLEPTADDRRKF